MDTPYFTKALETYRKDTGDTRQLYELPLEVWSRLMLDAQGLKQADADRADKK